MTDKKETGNQLPQTRVLNAINESLGPSTAKPHGERFMSSTIKADGYEKTRIRRLEKYHAIGMEKAFKSLGVNSISDLSDQDIQSQAIQRAYQYLQCCLVGAEKPVGSAKLFRKGFSGLAKLKKEVNKEDLIAAIKVAASQVGILGEKA